MGLRETVNQNSAVVTVGCIVLMVIALGTIYRCSMPGGGSGPTGETAGQQWFLDEGTNKLFLAKRDAIPPITAPSGSDGVRAFIFTCEKGCGGHDLDGKNVDELEELGLFIGYVEKISERGMKQLEKYKKEGDEMTMSLMMSESLMDFGMVRLVSSKKWYGFADPRASKIQAEPHKKCEERRFARPCMPGMK